MEIADTISSAQNCIPPHSRVVFMLFPAQNVSVTFQPTKSNKIWLLVTPQTDYSLLSPLSSVPATLFLLLLEHALHIPGPVKLSLPRILF
jgi:hypothetical protein